MRDRQRSRLAGNRRGHRRLPHARGRPPRNPVTYLRAVVIGASALLIALPLIADATIAATAPVEAEHGTCRVLRVIDGDTVDLWCTAKGMERARLTGFDTPELFSPQCPAEARDALVAKWALRRMLWQAERIKIVRDGYDRYDRVLVRVSVDGMPLAQLMVAAGHARPYNGARREGWC